MIPFWILDFGFSIGRSKSTRIFIFTFCAFLHALGVSAEAQQLEILEDAVPKLARVGLLGPSAANANIDLQLKELRPGAQALKLKLAEIESPADAVGLESAFPTAQQK